MPKKFSLKTRKVIFSKGPIHLVDCEVKMPDGRILSRQIIEHPGAVVIIPKVSGDRFMLIRQFRFAARAHLWEFPAGGRELGESLLQSARRELMEETGFFPKKLTKLVDFYPTPGISGEIMYMFVAEKLVPKKLKGDDDEDIETRIFTSAQILRMIQTRKIVDAKTILGFLYLKHPSRIT